MLSTDEIKNIASLARIGLNEKEVEGYQKDLSAILDYFKELEELDTNDIEPIGHITGRNNISSPDTREETSEAEREAILKNVPERKGNYVKVKSVL
ncbi:MAG: Asp-tRNA(Asn)/Glu-tRNA(Gln) amidotransferase subunit GatC [bacterium]|nr:Asp-tRNA(Asn)/Glu-tRNA(Gln) amidotransferase subunit GatC [bacterium]